MGRLLIDFEMNAGHEMTLCREPAIQRNEMYEVELGMLQAADIPSLLPMDWEHIDGAITFRYDLTNSRMLSHRLQQAPIGMTNYYELLLGVVDALSECVEHMLRPEGCLLDDSYIFVGEQLHDLRFVYVPIHTKDDDIGRSDLLSLVVKWSSYVDVIEGEGLRGILQQFIGSKWPLVRLRTLLLELIGRSGSSLPRTVIVNEVSREAAANAVQSEERPNEAPSYDSAADRYDWHAPELSEDDRMGDSFPLTDSDHLFESSKSRRGVWITLSAFLISTAAVWRFIYLPAPSQKHLYLSLSLTLALLAGTLFMIKRGSRLLVEEQDDEEGWGLEPKSGYLPPAKRRFQLSGRLGKAEAEEHVNLEHTTSSIGNYSAASHPLKAGHDEARSASAGADDSFVARRGAAEPTTLLSRHSSTSGEGDDDEAQAMLKRTWNGNEEYIRLTGEVFRIGRSIEGADYQEAADGVSRLHLEIQRSGTGRLAKDLGSRNGSLLNGTMMVPYKAYRLEPGDTIHLGGESGPRYRLD